MSKNLKHCLNKIQLIAEIKEKITEKVIEEFLK